VYFTFALDSFGDVKSKKYIDALEYTDKNYEARQKMVERDFKIIENMFNIQIDDLINEPLAKRKKTLLIFSFSGYRNFVSNNTSIRDKDLYLRFRYIKEKDEKIKEDIKNLIISNIEEFFQIKDFHIMEKDEKVKLINKAILENKQIQLESVNKTHILEPLKIYYDNGYWYFAALKNIENSFWIRIDNIVDIKLLEEDFKSSKQIIKKFRDYQWDAFGCEISEKKCTIKLKLNDLHCYKFFKIKKYKIQQKTYEKDGEYFVEFKFNFDWEIKPLIFQWIDVITIVDLDCGSSKEDTEFLQSLYDSSKEFFLKKEHEVFFENIIK
jgi:hypothetical protein